PELLIINNIEFDHADIFKDLDEIKLSFRRLLNIVPRNGMVLVNGDDANCVEVAKDCLAQMIEVGFSKNCAQRIRDVASSAKGSRLNLGSIAPSVSRKSAVGCLRTALQHNASRSLSTTASGRVKVSRWSFHCAGRQAGADP